MIILFGSIANPVIAYLCLALYQRGEKYLLLDARPSKQQFDFSWLSSYERNEGHLWVGDTKISARDIKSIYIHQIYPFLRYEDFLKNASSKDSMSGYRALYLLAECVDCLVVNKPSVCRSNASKAKQLTEIKKAGFEVPATIVTSDPNELKLFKKKCLSGLICKSVSGWRTATFKVTEDEKREALLIYCPTLFQEYIDGDDIRVHIVGSEVFATLVKSTSTDYRLSSNKDDVLLEAFELEEPVKRKCLALANRLGAKIAGIDLRLSSSGIYYCLELNYAPGFIFYQSATNQRIGQELVSLLMGLP